MLIPDLGALSNARSPAADDRAPKRPAIAARPTQAGTTVKSMFAAWLVAGGTAPAK